MTTVIDCFKAYDVRGRVPEELNVNIAYRIGRAFAEFLSPKIVVVGFDKLSAKSGLDTLESFLLNLLRQVRLLRVCMISILSALKWIHPNDALGIRPPNDQRDGTDRDGLVCDDCVVYSPPESHTPLLHRDPGDHPDLDLGHISDTCASFVS